VLAAIAMLAAAGGIAYASIPDVGGIVHSCYAKSSGAWRVIDTEAGQTCKSNEAPVDLYSRSGADLAFLDRTEADGLYLGKTAKASDSDKLDGKDSTDFLGVSATAADSSKLGGFPAPAYVLGGGILAHDVVSLSDGGNSSFDCCAVEPTPRIAFELTCDTGGGTTLVVSSPARFRWWWDASFGDATPVPSGYEVVLAIGNGVERSTLRAIMIDANVTTTFDLDSAIGSTCTFGWTLMKAGNSSPGGP
jgi:hypothetical protein